MTEPTTDPMTEATPAGAVDPDGPTPPYATREAAQASLEGFWSDVLAARRRHGVDNVLLVVNAAIAVESPAGPPTRHEFFWSAASAAEDKSEPMAAWLFGKVSAEREQRIRALLSAAPAGEQGPADEA